MLDQGNDSAMLRYTLGALLVKDKQFAGAIDHLRKAVELDANHSASWKLYAKALAAEGQEEAAVLAYEAGIRVAEERGDVQSVKEMRVFLKRLRSK